MADSSELAVIDSSHFLPDEDNVVLCLSNDKVFITDVLSKLNVLRMANIQLFGFSDIYELSSPDFDYLMHLKTIIASPYHIDVHNPEVMAFYKNFRETYYSEPSKYSVLAYDMTSHALYQLLHYGSVIGAYGQDDDMGLSMKFRYVRSKKGKLNSRVYLLQYKDYRIMPIIEEKQLNEEPLLEALPQKPKSELDRLKQISFD